MPKQGNSNVPKIRFKGFVEEWRELPVACVIRDHIERTVVHNQYPVLTSSQKHGIVKQTDYFANRQVTTEKNIGYLVLPRGYFSYRSRSDTDSFVFNRNDVIDKGIISYYYPVFEVKNCDADFFLRRINFGVQRQLSVAAEGTGQRVLAHFRFKKLTTNYPFLPEQAQIGKYFRKLDRLIELHRRKHDKLVTLKKAMLQKMFPQPGATTPEIRFKDFSGDWVEKRLGNIGEFNPKAALPEMFEYVDLESVVGTAMVSHRTETRETAPSRAQRVAKQGDLFFQTVRPYQKNNHLFSLPFTHYVFSTGYAQIRPVNDGNFLLGLVQRDQFLKEVLDHCTGTSYPAINSNVLADICVIVPSPGEQQKIGTYFRTLDLLISKHATQLQKLQQIKSACLEKMFV